MNPYLSYIKQIQNRKLRSASHTHLFLLLCLFLQALAALHRPPPFPVYLSRTTKRSSIKQKKNTHTSTQHHIFNPHGNTASSTRPPTFSYYNNSVEELRAPFPRDARACNDINDHTNQILHGKKKKKKTSAENIKSSHLRTWYVLHCSRTKTKTRHT